MEEKLLSILELFKKGKERCNIDYFRVDRKNVSPASLALLTVSITIPENVLQSHSAAGSDTVQNITVEIDLPFQPFLEAAYRLIVLNKQYATGGSSIRV